MQSFMECPRLVIDLPCGGSKCLSVRPQNLVHPCNLDECKSQGKFVCGRCKKRVYCSSACSQADWRDHKRYCEDPLEVPTYTKELLRMRFPMLVKATPGLKESNFDKTWSLFEEAEGIPADPNKFENFFCQLAADNMIGCSSKLRPDFLQGLGGVRLSGNSSAHAEIMALPLRFHNGVTAGAGVTLSFSCFGMDEDSGELNFKLVCGDMATGHLRFSDTVLGKPTKFDFERALFLACTKPLPMQGQAPVVPCRPNTVFVAHRWGEAVFEHVKACCEEIGISDVTFQSYEEAVESAAKYKTDPMGMNFFKEKDKGNGKKDYIYKPPAERNKKGR